MQVNQNSRQPRKPKRMKTLIQAAEIWVPDSEGYLLEFGGGLYDAAIEFDMVSRTMCFGRGEGLPGRVWEEGHPIILKDLQSSYFRRALAAKQAGLTCAAAMPFYAGDQLKAVAVMFCGSDPLHAGAVELWRNDPRVTTDMTLVDGYYGLAADAFAADSRETYLPRGSGLPGLAWQREGSVFMDGVSGSSKFVRAGAAEGAGITRGLALPCQVMKNENFALTFLSTALMPVARRVESWVPGASAASLQRAYGYDEDAGALLSAGIPLTPSIVGHKLVTEAFASATPQLHQRTSNEPGAMIVLPIVSDGVVTEVVALYF
jgi:hypothetical protein